jgi:hypothetical protein
MLGLPEVVQSQILSSFCDGKSASTYFHVILCNKNLNSIAFDLIRDALVDRYKNLAMNVQLVGDNEEIRDVLDIIREDIRTCKVLKSNAGRMVIDDGENSLREGLATKVSDYCAIIDYFDTMRLQKLDKVGEFILWCGELQIQGETIQRASLSSPFWSVTAMDFFYDQLELNCHCLCHPAPNASHQSLIEDQFEFGFLDVDLETDEGTFKRTRHGLSDEIGSSRFFLVPSQMEYEPTVGFSLNRTLTKRRCLECHWDGNDEGDFEYSLSHLPKNAIRILSRMKVS